MNKRRRIAAFAAVALVVIVLLLLRRCGPRVGGDATPVPTESPAVLETPAPTLPPPAPSPVKPAHPSPTPPPPKPSPALTRPPVDLHPELIPKDIKIVRVYYQNMIVAPGDVVEFDINGSGFTREFERMIAVQSGRPDAQVRDLSLVTPNQIHGRIATSPDARTDFSFPTVSIGEKTVFQAPEPFAVIRPGEVLNLVFTEMGESGRTGRFRVFTNLTQDAFSRFKVVPSTTAIAIGQLSPSLPFIVDGTILIGPAVTGEYGVEIFLDDKSLWQRDGIIRIVRPNLGQSGLVQRLQAEDGFHRPGDRARFLVQGSGFQFQDTSALSADVAGMDGETFTFVYLAPGRLGLDINLPPAAPEGPHAVSIRNGDALLLEVPNAFTIVPKNWVRNIRPEPGLKPGTAAQLVMTGRDLEKAFVEAITTEVDDGGLKVGPFTWVDDKRAVADIEAKAGVKPGDYQIRLKAGGRPVVPAAGDIITVTP